MKAWLKRRRRAVEVAGGVIALAALATAVALWKGGETALAEAAQEAKSRPPTMVQFTPAREMDFNESIVSDGTIRARYYSLVSPRIGGIIDDIGVREGDSVVRDQTRLFTIDGEKLRQAVDHSRQSLVIAKSTLDEKKASLVKAQADRAQAEKDFARTKSLYGEKVVPLSQYEVDETRVIQLEAQEKVAETNVTLAGQSVTLAEISLAMAEKDLRDSVMLSPITGVVSARHAEPGEMGSPGSPILRIDDTENLKAVAYLPGQFYPRIATKTSVAEVTVLSKKIGDFPVTYKAPAIDSALRTFEIWADVPGDGSYAVPGAQCAIRVVLRESRGVGVPRDAVQHREGKSWVFIPDGNEARMVEVNPGMDTGGWTELLNPPIKAGDRVITQGQFLLNDGYPIRERMAGGRQ